jgi:hypothetical protein
VEDSLQKWPVVCGSGWETTRVMAQALAIVSLAVTFALFLIGA